MMQIEFDSCQCTQQHKHNLRQFNISSQYVEKIV